MIVTVADRGVAGGLRQHALCSMARDVILETGWADSVVVCPHGAIFPAAPSIEPMYRIVCLRGETDLLSEMALGAAGRVIDSFCDDRSHVRAAYDASRALRRWVEVWRGSR